jgi:N-methylhydantoinase B
MSQTQSRPRPGHLASVDDPITFEVIKNALVSVADEMAMTIIRTGHSQVVRDNLDFSTAICDSSGRVVGQGCGIPFHLGAIPDAMSAVIERFGSGFGPGDAVILNDPAEGGMHLPDVFVIQPIFAGDELLGFATCVAHYPDIGGRAAGGNAVDSTDVFQEGLQIPILKLYDRHAPNETLLALLRKNVRVPDLVLGDLRAQLAACHVGAKGFLELADRYGRDPLRANADALLDYTERLVRAELSNVPDGSYSFEDHLDDDGFGSGPITIHVTLTFDGDEVTADFTGTSPQARSALNCTLSATKSVVYTALKCVMSPTVPSNEGMYRPIHVSAPLGTIANAAHPAARAARGITAFRMLDTVFGALHAALPGRVPAAGEGGATMIAMGGSDAAGGEFVFVDFSSGGWGGREASDGVDGTSPILANLANVPIEEIELRQPVRVLQYGFVPDTGGPGRTRGCLSVVREFRLLADSAILQIRSDRRRFPPYGLEGGRHGGPSTNLLNPGPDEELLPTTVTTPIARGDVLRHVTAGGGGYGTPLERPAPAVERDIADGKLSPESARALYGVVWDVDTGRVAAEETAQLRASLRGRSS